MENSTDKSKKQKLQDIWLNYIKPSYLKEPKYFVKDISNCNNTEVEYIILCESPHIEEVEHEPPLPLVGDSGKAIASFLFDENCSIGELIQDKSKINLPKIAIVNVCNVPLQKISHNENDVKNLSLDYLRNNCKIIDDLTENLKKRLLPYSNAQVIVVCGEFAQKYYDRIKDNFKKVKPLYVPHPSRNHWKFVYEHKDDISVLKWLFEN